jgi:hypothetical protein
MLNFGVLWIGQYYNVSVVAEINPATQGKSLTEGKRGRRSKKQQEDDEKNGRSSPPDDDSVSIFLFQNKLYIISLSACKCYLISLNY